MPSSKNLFVAAIRIIGLLLTIYSLVMIIVETASLFELVTTVSVQTEAKLPSGSLSVDRAFYPIQYIKYIITFLLGIYFVKGGQIIVSLAYKNDDTMPDYEYIKKTFDFSTKIMGLAIVLWGMGSFASYFDYILRINPNNININNISMYTSIPSILIFIIWILFGYYLLVDGIIIKRIAFPKGVVENK